MRINALAALAGAAMGCGAALAAPAVADVIDDAWPYGSSYPPTLALPGVALIAQGHGTNEGQDAFGPVTDSWGDYVATHTIGGSDSWYTVHDRTFIIPGLYTDQRTEVTGIVDDSTDYPSVGTVFDKIELFRSNSPIGAIDWFTTTSINDPDRGYATQFTLTPLLNNTFVFTDAGMKDVVGLFGQQFNLFEIPFSDTSDFGDAITID